MLSPESRKRNFVLKNIHMIRSTYPRWQEVTGVVLRKPGDMSLGLHAGFARLPPAAR